MDKIVKKAMKLIDQAVSLEVSGRYEEAIARAKEAVKFIENCKVYRDDKMSGDLESVYWGARYNYHIMRMIHDTAADSKEEYKALLRLWEDVEYNDRLEPYIYREDGVDVCYLKLLFYLVMFRFKECERIPEYGAVAENYQRVVEFYHIETHDGIDHFLSSNLCLAHFYNSKGNHLSAIRYYEKILDRLDENGDMDALTFQALVNLCFAYIQNGEVIKAGKLSKFLYDGYHVGKIQEPLQEDLQRLVISYANSYTMRHVTGKAVEIIRESLESGMIYHEKENDFMWTIYSAFLELCATERKQLDRTFLEEMLLLSEEMERSGWIDDMQHKSDKSEFYHEKSSLYLQLGDMEKALRYMDRSVSVYIKSGADAGDRLAYAACMTAALEFYAKYSEAEALKCAGNIMEQLPKFFSGAEYLLDNVQMEEYLATCNRLFYLAYSYFSSRQDNTEDLFVYSANYKNALLSVVRGRTKKIYHDEYNLSRIEKINELRDKLASGKNRKQRLEPKETAALSNELKELEMEFASLHKKNEEMPFFSFERIMTVLPRDTVLLEMIYSDQAAWRYGRTESFTGVRPERTECLDIFLLVKDRTVTLRHICIRNIEELREKIRLFKEKIMTPQTKYRKEANYICDTMFGEFRELLAEVENVILSPHGELYNLPFELAFESAWDEMQEKRYVYCQSVRDLFEHDFGIKEEYKDSCIIGAPKYSLSEEEKVEADRVRRVFDMEQIRALPYSEYEAKAVAGLLGCEQITGKDASKYMVKPGYSVIHIATHGLVQEIGERNIWYNSALTFAGVADWYASGKETERNGNGLLTAEEISRMNLGTVNLVVLSACNSGTSSFTLYEQQSGLHLAFGVAGVKYVISALWHVDDLATALCMKFFYEFLLETESVPGALEKAKERLRTVTAGELFSMVESERKLFNPSIYEAVYKYFKDLPKNAIPYDTPRYYAAFICYQYKF